MAAAAPYVDLTANKETISPAVKNASFTIRRIDTDLAALKWHDQLGPPLRLTISCIEIGMLR
jgi:hypothetical protein